MKKITNIKTLTGKLALFFISLSITIGLLTSSIFIFALRWSEDLVTERRLLIDQQVAIKQFKQSDLGHIQLDILTEAYNDLTLIPEILKPYILNKQPFIEEIYFAPNTDSLTISLSYYQHQGQEVPLVLLTKAEELEIAGIELFYIGALVLLLTGIMLLILGRLLFNLSTKLISPINSLSNQLEQAQGDINYQFIVSEKSSAEFQQLANELNRYRNEMQGLIKREQAFARYASHELRTPLTIAKGANKILANTQLNDYQQRQMHRTNDAITRMEEIVNALLSLVKYEREQKQIKAQLFTAQQLQSIVDSNSCQAKQKNINILINTQSEPKIKAEFAVMEMLVGNLIRNAIAATEQGEIEIILSTEYLQVLDLGSGLTADNNPIGHGLGLLIIDDICQRYHWTFTLTNREKQGCIAEISFSSINA